MCVNHRCDQRDMVGRQSRTEAQRRERVTESIRLAGGRQAALVVCAGRQAGRLAGWK